MRSKILYEKKNKMKRSKSRKNIKEPEISGLNQIEEERSCSLLKIEYASMEVWQTLLLII